MWRFTHSVYFTTHRTVTEQKPYGNRWYRMETIGIVWKPLVSYGNRWYRMETVGIVCKPLVSYGNRWYRMETVGIVWKPLVSYGNRWYRMETVGIVWKPLVSCGNRWYRMETVGIVCKTEPYFHVVLLDPLPCFFELRTNKCNKTLPANPPEAHTKQSDGKNMKPPFVVRPQRGGQTLLVGH